MMILIIGAAVIATIFVLLRNIARHGGAIVKGIRINLTMLGKTANLTKRGRV